MSLESYRRAKLVVLPETATVYQAARAMADNHIGAILIHRAGDPVGILTDRDMALAVLAEGRIAGETALADVMSEGLLTCSVNDDIADAARLMRDAAVRRIPVMEGERLAGMVTFDDLVLSGDIALPLLREIVHAQLVEAETALKPAGVAHPVPAQPDSARRARAAMRAESRAAQVYRRLVQRLAEVSDLDPARAEHGLRTGTCMLCHRLDPRQAQHLIAQLPSRLHASLTTCADGPDRGVTSETMRNEIGRVLNLKPNQAAEFLVALFSVLAENVSPGQMREVQDELPRDLAALFPAPRAA